jgi:hypothetical protein
VHHCRHRWLVPGGNCSAFDRNPANLSSVCFQVVIGTKVGRAKHMRIMPGGALETEQTLSGPSSIFVGRKLDDHRGSFILEYPMDKGYVVDGGWDAMESLWEVSLICFDSYDDVKQNLLTELSSARVLETKCQC